MNKISKEVAVVAVYLDNQYGGGVNTKRHVLYSNFLWLRIFHAYLVKKLLSNRPIKCWAPTIKNLKLHGFKHRHWTGTLALCTKFFTWVSVCGLKDSEAL